jgi:transcription initiation factor IIE alpha subunit
MQKLQQQTKDLLEEMFPDSSVQVLDKTLKMNKHELTDDDLNNLTRVEGKYKSLVIRRSGTGLVLIFNF